MASDTKSLAFNTPKDSTTAQPSNQGTYAKAAAKKIYHSKEQAIALDSIKGITIDDYIDGLEKVIDPNQITFISKISGRRVCIYLSNAEHVEKLSNQVIMIKETALRIRIKPVSQISHIRASLSKPGRSHILSFRRQVYIHQEEEKLIPESTQIVFEDTPHWIYFSTDLTR
ncbi:hypothetical protein TSAR_014974 [Trichomalopsis sarcophagae]|uniref:Uncharacterized protein n=1 Tax=Trichomalopsis sarcophagae TaxID=543379 RepID=A0A232EIK3_9HYME|nr:hypothetical protein TSAR_014974 [Trichomalopsis sarcophagae]